MKTRLEIGRDLKKILDAKKSDEEIARWADRKYANYREFDKKIDDILFSLSALSLGEEFHLSTEELYQIAEGLIAEGEKEDLSISEYDSQKAIEIDSVYLVCPICQECWEEHRIFKMVRCPKCNEKLYNPRFSNNQ